MATSSGGDGGVSRGSDTASGLPSLFPRWSLTGQAGIGTQQSLEQNLAEAQKGEMIATSKDEAGEGFGTLTPAAESPEQ